MAKEFTVKTVWFGEGVFGNVTFEETGDIKVKCAASAPFRDALKVGAKAIAKVDDLPAKGDFPAGKILTMWAGVSVPERPKGGGGGGGPRLTPEQFTMEKRSILASVALKEAREMLAPLGTDAKRVVEAGKEFYTALTSWAGVK